MKKHVLLLLGLVSAQLMASSVAVDLQPRSAVLGEAMQLILSVKGEVDEEIVIPKIEGIRIYSQGTSTNVSWINGSVSKQVSYTYSVVAERAGNFVIPALKLKIAGEWTSSQPISFSIEAPSAQLEGSAKETPQIFIEQEFSNAKPYVGEPLISTIKIFHRVQLADIKIIDQDLDAFRVLELQSKRGRIQRDGVNYQAIYYEQVLVPSHSGDLMVKGSKVQATIVAKAKKRNRRRSFFGDDFFDGIFDSLGQNLVKKTLAAKSQSLSVKALPLSERPDDFSGLVGEFAVSSKLSAHEIEAGGTVTMTLEFSGVGALDSFSPPSLNFGKSIKVYADQPTLEEVPIPTLGLKSKKLFKYALVFPEPGEFALAAYQTTLFNPKEERFVELRSELGTIKVLPSTEFEGGAVQSALPPSAPLTSQVKQEIVATGHDLIDIRRTQWTARQEIISQSVIKRLALMVGVALAFLLAVLGTKAYRPGRQLLRGRRASAFAGFARKEKVLAAEPKTLDALRLYYGAYREYLGEKFGLVGSALTDREIIAHLARSGATEEIIGLAQNIATQINQMEYREEKLAVQQIEAALQSIRKLVLEIESRC